MDELITAFRQFTFYKLVDLGAIERYHPTNKFMRRCTGTPNKWLTLRSLLEEENLLLSNKLQQQQQTCTNIIP